MEKLYNKTYPTTGTDSNSVNTKSSQSKRYMQPGVFGRHQSRNDDAE